MFLFDVENKSEFDVLKVTHIQQHMHFHIIIAIPKSYFFIVCSPFCITYLWGWYNYSTQYLPCQQVLENFLKNFYAIKNQKKAFQKYAKTYRNWFEPITNSFFCPYTNGFTEGCNNKIKVLKRNAFGMQDFKRFRNRILFVFQKATWWHLCARLIGRRMGKAPLRYASWRFSHAFAHRQVLSIIFRKFVSEKMK